MPRREYWNKNYTWVASKPWSAKEYKRRFEVTGIIKYLKIFRSSVYHESIQYRNNWLYIFNFKLSEQIMITFKKSSYWSII